MGWLGYLAGKFAVETIIGWKYKRDEEKLARIQFMLEEMGHNDSFEYRKTVEHTTNGDLNMALSYLEEIHRKNNEGKADARSRELYAEVEEFFAQERLEKERKKREKAERKRLR